MKRHFKKEFPNVVKIQPFQLENSFTHLDQRFFGQKSGFKDIIFSVHKSLESSQAELMLLIDAEKASESLNTKLAFKNIEYI